MKPATVDVPVHTDPTAGVIQIVPLQYNDPDVLPGPAHAPPATALPPPAVQMPVTQVKPPTVDAPAHAPPATGVAQVAPLQYISPDTLPTPEHDEPNTAPLPELQNPLEQVKPPAVPDPVQGVPIAGVTQVAPLQYKVPDTLPAALHAPPQTADPPL